MKTKLYLLLLAGLLITPLHSEAINCIQTKAAFDIGSGNTKLKVAKVDICKSKIIEVLLEESQKVEYKEDLSRNQKSEFSSQIMEQGIQTIQKLKAKAMRYKPKSFTAVATSAFRKATNTYDFIKKILKRTGVLVEVISQKEEARLGFLAGSSKSSTDPNKLIIWDIGGGSMQITAFGKNDDLVSYQGPLGSVTFKNLFITKIQNKRLEDTNTPNPTSTSELKKSLEHLVQTAQKEVPYQIKSKILRSDVTVIGTGGVHYYSIRKQVNSPKGKAYQLSQVATTLKKKSGLTDKQIGGPYASTEVTNLALVLGFMKGLNIYSVIPLKTNLTDGLLIDNQLINNSN